MWQIRLKRVVVVVRGYELLRQSLGHSGGTPGISEVSCHHSYITQQEAWCSDDTLPPWEDKKKNNAGEKQQLEKTAWTTECSSLANQLRRAICVDGTDTQSLWPKLWSWLPNEIKKKKKKLLKTFSPCTRYLYVYISADFVPFYFSSPVMHACFCAASLQVLWLIGNCNLSVAASVTLNACFSSWQLCDAFHCWCHSWLYHSAT